MVDELIDGSPDRVADEELLYRSVRETEIIREGGTLRISSQAFSDRSQQPSVDRASLCNHDPTWTQKSPTDAVVSLLAADVRGIRTLTRRDEQGREVGIYAIDVRPEPLLDNPAHAQVYADPAFTSKSLFRRLCERLAQMAQITLLP